MISLKPFKTSNIGSLVIMLLFVISTTDVFAYKSKSNKQNRVRIDVRPVQLLPGEPAKFEIRMNTHSGDLSQDLVAVSTLKDNSGREYHPTRWDGSPPGGHHRSGVLEFSELSESAQSITLIIREVAGGPERVFIWSVER